MPVAPQVCPRCGDTTIPTKPFCANCGLALPASPERNNIDGYIQAQIDQKLSEKLIASDNLVRGLGDKVEDVFWARIKRYGWIVALATTLFGLWGFNSIKDTGDRIVTEARQRIEPIIKDTEKRAQNAQNEIAKLNIKVADTKTVLDKTARDAEAQRIRIDSQSGDITKRLRDFQDASNRAAQASRDFETRANALQERLQALTRQYGEQVRQITKAADLHSISLAYPNLDQEPYVIIGSPAQRVDKAQKQPTDKWISLVLSPLAIERSIISKPKLEALLGELRRDGYTVFLGQSYLGGRAFAILDNFGANERSNISYFSPDFANSAKALRTILNAALPFPLPVPALVTGNDISPSGHTIIEKSGLDCQISVFLH